MLKHFPLAPFALAIFPILSMLASNANEVSLSVAIRPLLISLLVALLILVIFRLVLRRWDKASLVTSFILVVIFSYGQVYSWLEQNPIAGFSFGRHRYLIILYILVLLVGLWGLIFKLKNYTQALFLANIVSLTLLALPVLQLSWFSLQASLQKNEVAQAAAILDKPLKPSIQPLPDVYYIVRILTPAVMPCWKITSLTTLATLRSENMGFYIAACSRSNYDYTQGSMVAALNMDYLSGLGQYSQELNSEDIGFY